MAYCFVRQGVRALLCTHVCSCKIDSALSWHLRCKLAYLDDIETWIAAHCHTQDRKCLQCFLFE